MDDILFDEFFSGLPEERIFELFKKDYPWEPLKVLKDFLFDTLPELPKDFPVETPLREDLFLTLEGEVIPVRELEVVDGEYFFKGERVLGALIKASSYFSGRKFYLGASAIVEPFAYLKEPVYIGDYAEVRHAAYLRGSVYVSSRAVIGHTTEVKNSIFLPEAKAAHFAYVGDSILGRNVNLGAGTKLANLKFYKREIAVEIKGKVYKTGLKKFGAILGDNVQTGCNAVLQPGTLVGQNSFIFPGVVAGPGFIPKGSKIKK
ncbi:MAG: hypothetical protein JHC25_06195 [Thermodesulfobacterium sp.]|jgi:bifunctional N-acetylglucosamine-1-phosphate-uridyltransferase/glucosamine-1-phosphate-acetyltransferase GlmU-like protein|nr:hypothetical protein [Thermodesulfobacterium sp.]